MTAAMSEHPPVDGWTADDLERFPEDNVRRELLDGVLLVSPAPSFTHQKLAALLTAALDEVCPAEQEVTQNVDVRFGERRSFAPDVVVMTAAAAQRTERMYEPHQILLAVEIVSPTSIGMDTITKPAIYAAAGIPFYWRIETHDEIVVHSYRLPPFGDAYLATETFRDVIDTTGPWPMQIPISRITPRHRKA